MRKVVPDGHDYGLVPIEQTRQVIRIGLNLTNVPDRLFALIPDS